MNDNLIKSSLLSLLLIILIPSSTLGVTSHIEYGNHRMYEVSYYTVDGVDRFVIEVVPIDGGRYSVKVVEEPRDLEDPLYTSLITFLREVGYTVSKSTTLNNIVIEFTSLFNITLYVDPQHLLECFNGLVSGRAGLYIGKVVDTLNILDDALEGGALVRILSVEVSNDSYTLVAEAYRVKDGFIISKVLHKFRFNVDGWLVEYRRSRCYTINETHVVCGGVVIDNLRILLVDRDFRVQTPYYPIEFLSLLDLPRESGYILYNMTLQSINNNYTTTYVSSLIAVRVRLINESRTETFTVILRGGEVGIGEKIINLTIPYLDIYSINTTYSDNVDITCDPLIKFFKDIKEVSRVRLNLSYGYVVKEDVRGGYSIYSKSLFIDPIVEIPSTYLSNTSILSKALGLPTIINNTMFNNSKYVESGTILGNVSGCRGYYTVTYFTSGWLEKLLIYVDRGGNSKYSFTLEMVGSDFLGTTQKLNISLPEPKVEGTNVWYVTIVIALLAVVSVILLIKILKLR